MRTPSKRASSAVLWVAAVAGLPGLAAADTRCNFNPGWRLLVGDPRGAETPAFDDSSWKPVTLPRAWNEEDAFAKDSTTSAPALPYIGGRNEQADDLSTLHSPAAATQPGCNECPAELVLS